MKCGQRPCGKIEALIAFVLSPAFAGLNPVMLLTWGLRPRLYARACSAGSSSFLAITPQAHPGLLCKPTALHLLEPQPRYDRTIKGEEPMDAFNLLKADHEKVAKLFERLERASGKTKLNVFKQIKTELELHTHIEEKIFYPALEKPSETHDLTLEAYEEHNQVKKLLRELGRARTANDEWQAKAKVLQENVEHHVEEEENELFPKADQLWRTKRSRS